MQSLRNVTRDKLLSLSVKLEKSQLENFCMVLWSVWKERNNYVHAKPYKTPEVILSNAMNFLLEFQKAKWCIEGAPVSKTPGHTNWCIPDEGALKLNVDATLFNELSFMGVGIIIRNDRGVVLATQSIKIIGKFNPLTVELCAIRAGLVFPSKMGICVKFVENDSINAVAIVNSPSDLSSIDLIVSNIRSLLRLGGSGTYNFIPRSEKEVTHALA